MKISLSAIALLSASSLGLFAQGHSSSPANGKSKTPAPSSNYAVVEQGPHHRVWQTSVNETNDLGEVFVTKREYVELATGLNYQDASGQWKESREAFEVAPGGGFVARNGQHQLSLAPNLNSHGAVQLTLPDRQKLESRPIFLSFYDSSSGETVLIAQVKNCTGQLVASNVVLYEDAFDSGIHGDVRYTYTKAGMEQDVILHDQINPTDFGLANSDSVTLDMFSEFTSAPTPGKHPQNRAANLADESLSFGETMSIGPGKAFLADETDASVPVGKSWEVLEGRTFLIESVPYSSAKPFLNRLPAGRGRHAATKVAPSRKALVAGIRPNPTGKTEARLPSAVTNPKTSFVVDYVTLLSGPTNYTFIGYNTYFINGTFSLNGDTIFEGGTVVKYAANSTLQMSSTYSTPSISFRGGAYRPVVFTSKDDNAFGETISGSTGNPSSAYYANPALYLSSMASTPTLANFRICYAKMGIQMLGSSASANLYDAQFINCQNGLMLAGSTARLRNALFANTVTNFNFGGGATVEAQNVTFSTSRYLVTTPPVQTGCSVSLTNCILANVTNLVFGVLSSSNGNFNGVYNSQPFGSGTTISNTTNPFQTVGAASYYLNAGCVFANAGTMGIDSTLLGSLSKKTVYPPIVFSSITFNVSTNFSPRVLRDTDTPDLGFHYDPLDWVFSGCRANTNVSFSEGTAVGWYELPGSGGPGYGLSLPNDVTATFNGTLSSNCIIARYSTVQEGANGNWKDKGWLAAIISTGTYDPAHPSRIVARFTRGALIAAGPCCFRDYNTVLELRLNHCEFYNGNLGGYNTFSYYTNCLLDRIYFWQGTSASVSSKVILRNCTHHGGNLEFAHWEGAAPWWYTSIRDCAFEDTAIATGDLSGGNPLYVDYDYNAFLPGASRTGPQGNNDVIVTNGYNWQVGLLGPYYLPTNSTLIDAGSVTNAGLVGLYHFTTQINQVKDGSSRLDIGYHYVALNAFGNPFDTDGDSIPDYLEDTNGNGIFDSGDRSDFNLPGPSPCCNIIDSLRCAQIPGQ